MSTDAGNEEVEMFIDLHFDPTSSDGEVCIRNTFSLSSTLVVQLLKAFLIPSREWCSTCRWMSERPK